MVGCVSIENAAESDQNAALVDDPLISFATFSRDRAGTANVHMTQQGDDLLATRGSKQEDREAGQPTRSGVDLASIIRSHFGPTNGVDLELPPREHGREPPSFESEGRRPA